MGAHDGQTDGLSAGAKDGDPDGSNDGLLHEGERVGLDIGVQVG